MTKIEQKRCENLIEEAKRNLNNSDMEYSKYKRLQKEEKKIDAECALRNADQLRGYAEGIYQALTVIGYYSASMEELTERFRY